MSWFEDIDIGGKRELGSHSFSAEEIKRFANAWDPQPFHTDEEAAAKSHFGALCASGWHTLAIMMRVMMHARQRQLHPGGAGASGVNAAGGSVAGGMSGARLGPSPGFDDLKWLKPVYAGDTIAFSTEIIEKRESRSRPGWGLIRFRNIGVNQDGAEVLTIVGAVYVEKRNAEAG